ncbi:hypothetical protein H0H92_014208 [Tricholoma furcatifolium]|nr:hypothetical protein H0H92_014208 [Tricholoma furcatifolium]
MSFPQRRVLYRLQPVAFDTCLELWDFEEEGVRLQSVKEIDLQQWLFIGDSEISGSEAESVGGDRFDRFYIVSAPTKAQRFCRYLTVLPTTGGSPAHPQALTEEEAEPSLWTLTKSKTNDGSYFRGGSYVYEAVQSFQRGKKTTVNPRDELSQYLELGPEPTEDVVRFWGVQTVRGKVSNAYAHGI